MKSITNEYKSEIYKFGRQIDCKITYNLNGETIELGKDKLNSVAPHYEGGILKSIMKQLDIDSNENIPIGTSINCQFGVKTRSGKNLFDKDNANIKIEYIDANGNWEIDRNDRKTILINCKENTIYTISKIASSFFRVGSFETIPVNLTPAINYVIGTNTTTNITINTGNNAQYLAITYYSTSDTLTEQQILNSIQIEVGPATEYEPFGEFDYINLGNYIVYSSEIQEDTLSYKLVCYDKMLYSMVDYANMGITYPITIRSYINSICTFLGITFKNASDTFANYDKEIQKELYLDDEGNSLDYTFRDVLDELAQVTASTICINEQDDELEIRYINDTEDTIDEKYLKDINVKFGEKYGPVNSIVLSRASEADNIYLRDEESVEEDGLCEIKIKDNQIMNFNDRDQYLSDILEALDGLEYYLNDFSSTGITYYEVCDKYNITIDDTTYSCIMFNDEINISQGLEEIVHTDRPNESETDYKKADKTDRKVNQTYIIADKQKGQIEALTSRTETLETETGNMYTIEQVNQLIQTAETGVTNTFSEAGGNNIFRNTGLWFESGDNNNPYEFWNGIVSRISEDNSSNHSALLLQNNTLYQDQNVSNGNYTISFKYKKIIPLSEISVKINDIEYELTEDNETEFVQTIEVSNQHIKVEFISDTDDSCEIYDLMVNAGSVKLAYSQNQNETTTDTVNISKGITITSSDDENVVFKANADGVRIYEKNDMTNPKTKFTNKGTETNYIEVKDEAIICDVLIQKIGSHTWFTKI